MRFHKRLLSFVLTLSMLLTLLPTSAFAAEDTIIEPSGIFSVPVDGETDAEESEISNTDADVPKELDGLEQTADPEEPPASEEPTGPEETSELEEPSETETVSFPEGTMGCEGDDLPNSAPYEPAENNSIDPNQLAYPVSHAEGDTARYSVLVLDTSASSSFEENGRVFYTADTAIEYVKASAKKFVGDVRKANGTNYVAVVEYKNSVSNIVSGFTTDYDALIETIDGLYSSGNVRSVAYGLQKVNALLDAVSDPDAIKNVVLFTTGMTNEGPYSYSGKYNSSTIASNWRRMDTQVRLYAYSNSAIAETETIKRKATLYTVGLFQVMEEMPQAGRDVVEFFKLFTKDMATSEKYFYDVKDPSQLEFVFGGIAEDITTNKKTGSFWYASGDDYDYSATFYYDDEYFATDASTYNESLATMSLCLALSAFGSNRTDDYAEKSQNARDLLEQIGFDEDHIATNEYFTVKPHEDSMGVIVGHKPIEVDGEKGTLIALATRGGGYEAEWAGNFTIGAWGRHEGFSLAVEEVERYLSTYVEDHRADLTGTVKIWMAGYSRAAATVNLVAADLTKNGGINGLALDKENIYAYCYEPPMGENITNISKNTAKTYTNIHNIVNPSDLVTKVAMRDWGFVRYGTDEPVIPTQLTTSSSEKFDEMFEKFKALNTDAVKESIVKGKNGKDTHIINTFQAKELDPALADVSFEAHWEKITGPSGLEFYVWVPNVDVDWNPRLISDTNQSMSAFLDSLITTLSVGLKNRIDYTAKLQPAVRIIASQFMGKGYEAYKWDRVPDIFAQKMESHIWDVARTLILSGYDATLALITSYLYESISDAGIDLYGYASIPTAFITALRDVLDAIVASVFISGGNDLITLFSNVGMLFHAHYPELCLAWMQMQDPNYTPDGHRLFVIDCYRVVHINCPVDISVYDRDNQLVAQIVGDVPQDINGSSIVAAYTADGEKLIYLPADENYRVDMRATDAGTVNYSVTEYSYDTCAYAKIVNYYDIPVEMNDTLSGSLNRFDVGDTTNTGDGSSVVYTLALNGKSLTPDETRSGESAATATYLVTAMSANSDSGAVIGGGAYTKGAYAQVSALPYNGCTFQGWYEGENLVSQEQHYRIRVESDVELTARFAGTRPTVGNGTYELTITAGTGGAIKQGATGYYVPNEQISLIAEPNPGYVFAGWTATSGTLSNAASASTTFTTPEENAVIKASFTVVSQTRTYQIYFDANGGTVNIPSMTTEADGRLSGLPSASRSGYTFDGWYTDLNGGSRITAETIFSADTTVYAHWSYTTTSGSSGGSSSRGGTSSFINIKTDGHGSVTSNPKNTGVGGKITLTVRPHTGYILNSLTAKGSGGKEVELAKVNDTTYTFIKPVGSVTVNATFVSDESQPDSTSTQTFYDIPASHWASTEINWALANGIMNGTGNGVFSPDNHVTRQQTWMVLGRLAGTSPANMAEAKSWAVNNSISDGTSSGNSLTRQQLVTLLYRYAQLKGYATTGGVDISAYPDYTSVAVYAKEAMSWAVGNGIVAGTSDGRLNSTGTATRAQFAVIMYRFNQKTES